MPFSEWGSYRFVQWSLDPCQAQELCNVLSQRHRLSGAGGLSYPRCTELGLPPPHLIHGQPETECERVLYAPVSHPYSTCFVLC